MKKLASAWPSVLSDKALHQLQNLKPDPFWVLNGLAMPGKMPEKQRQLGLLHQLPYALLFI